MITEIVKCKSRNTAKRKCPWAAVVAKCDGGFIAFADIMDYAAWRKQ